MLENTPAYKYLNASAKRYCCSLASLTNTQRPSGTTQPFKLNSASVLTKTIATETKTPTLMKYKLDLITSLVFDFNNVIAESNNVATS